MSSSPSDKNSNKKPDIQFTTGDIGRWSSRQEDPFAEQNRKRAVKKQTRNAKRQKAAPIVVIIISVILVATAIVGLVFLIIHLSHRTVSEIPEINGSTTQDIANYRDLLQNFYNKRPDATEDEKLQAVQDAVNSALDTANGRENESAIKVAQVIFLSNNNLYTEAAEKAKDIDENALDPEQKMLFYSIMYNIKNNLGQVDEANDYYFKMYELNEELGGVGGGN